MTFHNKTIEDVVKQLDSSPQGISDTEAQARLIKHGYNSLPDTGRHSLIFVFLSQFKNPLIYILLVAATVAVYLEETAGSIFIFLVLLVNAVIGTIQEFSAENAVAQLKKMVLPVTRIMRNGHIKDIDARFLVPGDIVLLESGFRIPADIRLIETTHAQIDEAILTGESQEVRKQADIICEQNATTSDQHNMAFAGTMVTSGRLTGIVTATGSHTKIGHIANRISEESKTRSPLIIRMESFTRQVTYFVFIMIIIIGALLYFRGYEWHYIFMLSIGIAVAAIPEGLPVTLNNCIVNWDAKNGKT